MVAAVVALVLFAFVMSMASVGSWSNSMLTFFGDSPKLWDSKIDAQNNGTAVVLPFVELKVMDKPAGYSEKMMKQIASRYAHNAQELNVHRSASFEGFDGDLYFVGVFLGSLSCAGVEGE